jgi:hypothetical protein
VGSNSEGLGFPQFLGHERGNLARFRVAMGRQFGVEQAGVQAHFKATSVRGDEADAGNLELVLAKQFGRQTDSAFGVVSNRTIDNLDFMHVVLLYPPDLRASISRGRERLSSTGDL